MKIGVMIFILFVHFMIIGGFGGLHSYYLSSKKVLTEQTYDSLQVIAESKAKSIEFFLHHYQHMAHIVLSNPNLEVFLGKDVKDPGYETLANDLGKDMQNLVDLFEDILAYSVFNSSGEVIYSTSDISTFLPDKEILSGLDKAYFGDVYFKEGSEKLALPIALPVLESDELKGGIIMEVGLEKLFEITTDVSGLGESGEIYLINKERYMITPSESLGSSTVLKQKIDTENSMKCFEEEVSYEEKEVKLFENYLGVEVLGTYAPLSKTGWCLLVEVDEKESIGKLKSELAKSALVIAIILSFIMAFFVLLSDNFIRESMKQKSSGVGK